MFTLQTGFKPLLLKWGEYNPLVQVTVNSKEENSYDFVPITSKYTASGQSYHFYRDISDFR
jgi:hypothetical protein